MTITRAIFTAATLTFAAAAFASASQTLFNETFGNDQANPTASTFTVDNTWHYSDSQDTEVNGNASRLYNPGGSAIGTNSVGWISNLASGNSYQQISSTGSFTGVPALTTGQQYQLTLTFFAGIDSGYTDRLANAYVEFASAGKTFSFVSGSSGAQTNVNFLEQTLSNSSIDSSSIRAEFIAQGGTGGFNTDRTFTITFTTNDELTGDFDITLGRGANNGSGGFVYFDNVKVDVSVVNAGAIPEPSTYGLMGAGALGAVALVRRRRKAAKAA